MDAPAWQEVAQPQHMSSYFWAETSCCAFLLPSVTSEVGGTRHLLSNWSTPTLSKTPQKSCLLHEKTKKAHIFVEILWTLPTNPHISPDCKSSVSHADSNTDWVAAMTSPPSQANTVSILKQGLQKKPNPKKVLTTQCLWFEVFTFQQVVADGQPCKDLILPTSGQSETASAYFHTLIQSHPVC